MSQIIACIMMKNESKVIERCLKSLCKYTNINAFIITDTGSDDNSCELAINTLNESGKTFIIIDVIWENFGKNRSTIFELAQIQAKNFKFENAYALIIDADMEFNSVDYILSNLTDDAYVIDHKIGDTIYRKEAIIKLSNNWKSVGKVHEYWKSENENLSRSILPLTYIYEHIDGSNRENKFKRDYDILFDEYNKEKNVRTVFYLAQTCKDQKKYEEAIKYYNERIENGGWDEEIWYSIYMTAECTKLLEINKRKDDKKEDLNTIEKIINLYTKAFRYRPHRAESLYSLIYYLINVDMNLDAYIYANIAKDIPIPIKDILFINIEIYMTYIPHLYVALLNNYLRLTGVAMTPFNNETDLKKRKKLQTDACEYAREFILRKDINFDSKSDALCLIEKFSPEIFDAYDIKHICISNENFITYTSCIYYNEVFKFLIMKKDKITIFNLDINTLKLKPQKIILTNDMIDPDFIYINNNYTIMYFDNRNFNYNLILNLNDNNIQTSFDTKICSYIENNIQYIQNLEYYTEYDKLDLKPIESKFSMECLLIIGMPLITNQGLIFLAKVRKISSYIFILQKDKKIIATSPIVNIGKMHNITTFCPIPNGKILLVSGLDILIIDSVYIIKLINHVE